MWRYTAVRALDVRRWWQVGILTSSGIYPDRAIQVVSAARGLAVPETTEQREWVTGLTVKPSAATPIVAR